MKQLIDSKLNTLIEEFKQTTPGFITSGQIEAFVKGLYTAVDILKLNE